MKYLVRLLLTAGVRLTAVGANAQPPARGRGRDGQLQEPPKNLQVLAKDTPRPEVIATMGAFAS